MVQTILWQGNQAEDIAAAAQYLQAGELVAFPTETVYGLGADALNEEAIRKIFMAKDRPMGNPLSVLIYDLHQLAVLVRSPSEQARRLMTAFWPGPLTLVLPKVDTLLDGLTGGLPTIGVRMPNHPVALDLLKTFGKPIAAPSANLSGRLSPTCAEHVAHDLTGRIAGIIDGGACPVGVESTVLDMTTNPPTILRLGGVSLEAIERLIGPVQMAHAGTKAPGLNYKHYATQAEIILCADTPEEFAAHFAALKQTENRPFGLLISAETAALLGENLANIPVRVLGYRSQPETLAHGVFAALRWFDEQMVEVIYGEHFPDEQIGAALMDRLQQSAHVASTERRKSL